MMALLICGWIGMRIAYWPQSHLPSIEELLPSAVLAEYGDIANDAVKYGDDLTGEWALPPILAQYDLHPAWHPIEDGYSIDNDEVGLRQTSPPFRLAVSTDPQAPEGDLRAGAHRLMWLAAVTRGDFNYPALGIASNTEIALPLAKPAAVALQRSDRWSADAWLFLREGTSADDGVAPASYGGSQGGALLRYRLAPGSRLAPNAYGRVTGLPRDPADPELALGLSLRPLSGLPVRAQVEMRLRERAGRVELRPSVAAVGYFERVDDGLEARGYAQAGYVGGSDATAFADGRLTLAKVLANRSGYRLSVGAGSWAGAQDGVSRLDIGPTAAVTIATERMTARVEADYRLRIAGNAEPDAGPTLTLSASF